MEKIRCAWTQNNEWNNRYHDEEWGVPVHDDAKLFEFLVLDAFQAGLSWLTILKKRDNFRNAFDGFNTEIIAQYTQGDVERLMLDAGIIRNRLKIESTITNARAFRQIQAEYGSFDAYIWQFTGGKTLVNQWTEFRQVPSRSAESDAMSKALKKKGFKFVGTTICYAFMQAAGMINDHTTDCYRYHEVMTGA